MNDNLIILKQMPVITQKLEDMKPIIENMVEQALSLECTNETVKEIKCIRADLNKKSGMLEQRRKEIKKQINAPYEAMNRVYVECIDEPFRKADAELKRRIAEVEDIVKKNKEDELKAYFADCISDVGFPEISFDRANINVTLSASMKSLKEAVDKFIEKTTGDLAAINQMEYADEILIEYKKTLDLAVAISTVSERKKSLADLEQSREEAKRVEKVLRPPVLDLTGEDFDVFDDDEMITAVFTITNTSANIGAVKRLLGKMGYEYGIEYK